MMGEIVDDRDSVYLAANFAAAAHTLECLQRLHYYLTFNFPGVGGDDCCQRVTNIEISNQRRRELSPLGAVAPDIEAGHAFGKPNVTCLPLRIVASPKGLEVREQLLTE